MKFDPSHLEDHDDVAALNNLDAAPLLHLLKRRYLSNSIYTNVSNISISFNPYAWIEGLYDNTADPKYSGDAANPPVPHVYSVAARAYTRMISNKEDQSVIVSGESGAGKTEACKKVMKYLAETSSKVSGSATSISSSDASVSTVEQKVMDCNPFLEAFGNAKTVRNDNSSRFGKFIKIEYSNKRIVGATMCHYLLEKSRVVYASSNERNYHIFYQLLSGCTDDMKTRLQLHLGTASDYRILNQGALTVDGVDDCLEFNEVLRALKTVGATQAHVDAMMELLSGIMLLGNISFIGDSENNASIDPRSIADSTLAHCCSLLKCEVLQTKLTSRIVKAKGRTSVYTVQLTKLQAEEARDALGKSIYDNIFSYLVKLCNDTLKTKETDCVDCFIGILDIFGFEIFKINSFEQLCINYANEKLQSLFNHTVFVAEQVMYTNEGINCEYIGFKNNKECVDLIELKPVGLLPVLDEICMLGRTSDNDISYLTKLSNAHNGKNKYYAVKRVSGDDSFVIKHFAGDVVYCVDGFISKNSDKLLPDLLLAMRESSNDFVKMIFNLEDEGASGGSVSGSGSGSNSKRGSNSNSNSNSRGRSDSAAQQTKSPTTIGYKFKNQLAGLYSSILSTTPHYIRCVKPNNNKKPLEFDSVSVMEQLRCNGTLEMVRIRREGYPMREEWKDLWDIVVRHEYWKEARVDPKSDYKTGCEEVFRKALPSGYYQVAKSGKVFMKHDTYDKLSDWKIATNAILVQTKFRVWYYRKLYKKLLRRIIVLQRCVGGFMARQKYKKHVTKIVKCQSCIRMFVTKNIIVKRKIAVRNMDTYLYAFLVGRRQKIRYDNTKKFILIIQSIARARAGKKKYDDLRYQQIIVQDNIKKDQMASVIGGRLKKKQVSSKLELWIQEAFSAASWGDNDLLRTLISCSTPEWAVLRDIKESLANVRDRMDGMKTLLHVCAINGNSDAIDLLVHHGALCDVVDSEGNTPLIRSAGCGDSHLKTSELIVENCRAQFLVSMLNRVNGEQHSAMDVALSEGAESELGSAETVKLLLKAGAKSGKGTAQDKVKQMLEDEERRKREKEEMEERREKEMLEAARKERELDPHFQFMKMQQNVDNTALSAAKLEEARKAELKKKEVEQQEKVKAVQKRRVSARASIFGVPNGKLGIGLNTNLLGETISVRHRSTSDGASFDSTSTLGTTSSSKEDAPAAEAKTTTAPVKKISRRVSAKATDNTWAVKSNVPYKSLGAKNSAGDAEAKTEDLPRPVSGISKSDSIVECDEEEYDTEERGSENEKQGDAATARTVTEESETLPPPAPAGSLYPKPATPTVKAEDAAEFTATLVKMVQIIQDMSTEADRKGWYYLNTEGGEEGPFADDWMHSWLADKALNGSTQIRLGDGLNFVQLSSIIPNCDDITLEMENPFVFEIGAQKSEVEKMLARLSK
jgi:myosin heavy subunit